MPNCTQGLLSLFLVITCCGGMAQETVKLGIRQNMIKPTVGNNGVFWSHGVAHHIYTQAGYKSKIISRPAKRLPQALDRGEVDFIFSTKSALGEFQGKFIRSKLPTTMLAFHIYYDHRKDWQPTWPPDKIFKQKIGKSAHSAVTLRDASQLNISLATSFDAPVKMVNLGRADYYIENIAGMLSISPGLLKTPEQGFTSKVLFSKGVFSYFQDTKQGKKLAVIFNRELLALYQRGEYGTLFYTHAPFYIGSDTVDDAVDFINKTNPELKIPQQPSGRTIIKNSRHLP